MGRESFFYVPCQVWCCIAFVSALRRWWRPSHRDSILRPPTRSQLGFGSGMTMNVTHIMWGGMLWCTLSTTKPPTDRRERGGRLVRWMSKLAWIGFRLAANGKSQPVVPEHERLRQTSAILPAMHALARRLGVVPVGASKLPVLLDEHGRHFIPHGFVTLTGDSMGARFVTRRTTIAA